MRLSCARSKTYSVVYLRWPRFLCWFLLAVALVAGLRSLLIVRNDVAPVVESILPAEGVTGGSGGSSPVDKLLKDFLASIDNVRVLVHRNASVDVSKRPFPVLINAVLGPTFRHRVAFEDPSLTVDQLRMKFAFGNADLSLHAIVSGDKLLVLDTSVYADSPDLNATFHDPTSLVPLHYRHIDLKDEQFEFPLALLCEALPEPGVEVAVVAEGELKRRLAAAGALKGAPPPKGKKLTKALSGKQLVPLRKAVRERLKKKNAVTTMEGGVGSALAKSLSPEQVAVLEAKAASEEMRLQQSIDSLIVSNETTKRSLLYYNLSAQVSRARPFDVASYRTLKAFYRGALGGPSAFAVAEGADDAAAKGLVPLLGMSERLLLGDGKSSAVNSHNNQTRFSPLALVAGGREALRALARAAGHGERAPRSLPLRASITAALQRRSDVGSIGIADKASGNGDAATSATTTSTSTSTTTSSAAVFSSAYVCTRDTVEAALLDLRHNGFFASLFNYSASGSTTSTSSGASQRQGSAFSAFSYGSDLLSVSKKLAFVGSFCYFWISSFVSGLLIALVRAFSAVAVVWPLLFVAFKAGNMNGRPYFGHILRLAMMLAVLFLFWLFVVNPLLPGGTTVLNNEGTTNNSHGRSSGDEAEASNSKNEASSGKSANPLSSPAALFGSFKLGGTAIQSAAMTLTLLVVAAHIYDDGPAPPAPPAPPPPATIPAPSQPAAASPSSSASSASSAQDSRPERESRNKEGRHRRRRRHHHRRRAVVDEDDSDDDDSSSCSSRSSSSSWSASSSPSFSSSSEREDRKKRPVSRHRHRHHRRHARDLKATSVEDEEDHRRREEQQRQQRLHQQAQQHWQTALYYQQMTAALLQRQQQQQQQQQMIIAQAQTQAQVFWLHQQQQQQQHLLRLHQQQQPPATPVAAPHESRKA